jgi:hypothetical protein
LWEGFIHPNLEIPSSLKLVQYGLQVARFIIQEALDDFLASHFAKEVQNITDSVRKRHKALLWLFR